MKATFFSLTAISLLQFSQATPAHIGNHARQHARRAVVTKYVTADAPVMVYVDQNGKVLSTGTGSQPTAQAQPQAAAPAPAQEAAPAPAPAPAQAAPAQKKPQQQSQANNAPTYAQSQQAPASVATSAATSAQSASTYRGTSGAGGSSSGGASGAIGINYSPYHTDHSCKTADQVMKDFDGFAGYGVVRSYGTDCDQVPSMVKAAKAKNMKIMLGIYKVQDAANEAGKIVNGIKAAGGDWGIVHSVGVGNEAVNSGQASVNDVLTGLQTAKGLLQGGGYIGKIAAVDTFNQMTAHPELCQASDYAAINAHAFFDSTISADKAGDWLKNTVQSVKDKCKGKDVIVTESGWPSQGGSNGVAVASSDAQKTAISKLKGAFPSGGMFLFSAYNDLWKEDFTGSHGCEKYWGILGNSPN